MIDYRTTSFSSKPHFYLIYSALAWCLYHIFETFLLYFWFLFICKDMVFFSKHQRFYWISAFETQFWQIHNRSVCQFHQFTFHLVVDLTITYKGSTAICVSRKLRNPRPMGSRLWCRPWVLCHTYRQQDVSARDKKFLAEFVYIMSFGILTV